MCIHRFGYPQGKEGDQAYVTDLANGVNENGRKAAAIMQTKIDSGVPLTEKVIDEVYDTVYAEPATA